MVKDQRGDPPLFPGGENGGPPMAGAYFNEATAAPSIRPGLEATPR